MEIRATKHYSELEPPEDNTHILSSEEIEVYASYIMGIHKEAIWGGVNPQNYYDMSFIYHIYEEDKDGMIIKTPVVHTLRSGISEVKKDKDGNDVLDEDNNKILYPHYINWYREMYDLFLPMRKFFDDRSPIAKAYEIE